MDSIEGTQTIFSKDIQPFDRGCVCPERAYPLTPARQSRMAFKKASP